MARSTKIVKRPRKAGELFGLRAAIRNHCLECVCYSPAEVRRCTSTGCHLWAYRLGSGIDSSDKAVSAVFQSTERQNSPHKGNTPRGELVRV
jgi:hypothetical protein